MKRITCLILIFLFSGCFKKNIEKCNSSEFYQNYWTWLMETYPGFASSEGWGERHNKFFESTVENFNKVNKEVKLHLKNTEKLLKNPSCASEKVSLSLLQNDLKIQIEGHHYKTYLIQFSSRGGAHIDLAQMHKRVPLKSFQNYQDYLERLSKIPNVFKRVKELSLMGIEKGITPSKVTFKNYESSFLDLAGGDVEDSPFYSVFKNIHKDIKEKDKEKLRNKASEVILKKVQPAYRDLHQFWVNKLYPNLRTSVGASNLPDGKKYYQFMIKKMTTLNKTAEEIHKIGLSEVSRILEEMEKVKVKVKFKGTLREFFKELRTNKKYYAKTEDELLQKTAVILKKIDGKLPSLFKVLPMLPYGLEPIPSFIAHKSPAAYYYSGNIKISKAGMYLLNISNLESRPLYNLVALSLHEAVPGHHLQLALSQEIKEMPEFRKTIRPTAFIEGWGLYAESLGLEVGMYTNPYDNFGRLNYEQWRALRLVVDTGLHAMGWSRDRAIKYMESNSGLSRKNIINEVDRYINGPAQALAYKMGELKIKELRARAKKSLGKKFDVRDFHDVVLRNGSIPLSLLESNVNDYIKDFSSRVEKKL